MNSKKLTAVLYSKNDALRFVKERPKVDRVYPLTPDARAVLLPTNLPLLNTMDFYTDYGHSRVLARVRHMERTFLKVLKEEKELSIAAKETLRGEIHAIASISGAIWRTLKRSGPWHLPSSDGWITFKDTKKAHKHLLKYLLLEWKAHFVIGTSPLTPLIRFFNYKLVKRENKKAVFFTDYSYGLSHLADNISNKTNLHTYCVKWTRGDWKDLLSLIKQPLDILKGENRKFLFVVPKPLSGTGLAVERVLSSIKDPVISQAVGILYDYFVKMIVMLDGLHKDIEFFIKTVRPKQIIAGQLRWGCGAVLGEIAQRYGIPTLLISHGSHTTQSSSASAFEHRENAQGLLVSPLADETLVQSPHAEKYILNIKSDIKKRRSKPIMWAYKNIGQNPSKNGIRHILHAGSCKPYTAPRPWIYETPDEFVKGLQSLILATSSLKETKLIIRIRPQAECSVDSLRKLLPKMDHYVIKTSGTFLEDLSIAHLLVSFSSTTIEEALHAHCPVLLWGGSMRYKHLQSRKRHPAAGDRGAVYSVEKEAELGMLIKAILDVHAGHPLTEDELKQHVWKSETPGINELIQRMKSC